MNNNLLEIKSKAFVHKTLTREATTLKVAEILKNIKSYSNLIRGLKQRKRLHGTKQLKKKLLSSSIY